MWPISRSGSNRPMRKFGLPDFVNEAAARLESSGVDSPRLNAELLLAHVLKISRSRLFLRELHVTDEARAAFDALIEKRAEHHPLQYLTGETEFMEAVIRCEPAALIPRPETEGLADRVIQHVKSLRRSGLNSEMNILEIGTGSGCVAVALAMSLPECRITATDLSPEALNVAGRNACLNKVEDRIVFHEADLFPPADHVSYDVIVSNPPYVSEEEFTGLPKEVAVHEPRAALAAGPEGTEILKRIIAEAPRYLAPNGVLFLEMGERQGEELLGYTSWGRARVERDLAGRDRYVIVESR